MRISGSTKGSTWGRIQGLFNRDSLLGTVALRVSMLVSRARLSTSEADLLLDVCHLSFSEVQGCLGGLAGHRLQLCIAQGKAQQGEREAVDQQD